MSDILSIINRSEPIPVRLGDRGEALAATFLVEHGYRLVMSNFKVPVGRNSKGVAMTGEIDLIALDGETLCFIEVKTRRSDEFTSILTNVNRRKQRQIIRTARVYRRIFDVRGIEFRYDVVTVLMPKSGETAIEIYKGFWNEQRFRKRTWNHEPWADFV